MNKVIGCLSHPISGSINFHQGETKRYNAYFIYIPSTNKLAISLLTSDGERKWIGDLKDKKIQRAVIARFTLISHWNMLQSKSGNNYYKPEQQAEHFNKEASAIVRDLGVKIKRPPSFDKSEWWQ